MNLLVWPLALSFLIVIMAESVTFQRATVCRQEAWLKSTELMTRSLLTEHKASEHDWHFTCRIHLTRNQEKVTWQRLPSLHSHPFEVTLKGTL